MIKFGRPITVDVDAVLPRAVDALARDGRVDAIWLFGSRARNEADALSDVDLAVLARWDLHGRELWDAHLDWIGLAVEALGTDEVGIHVVNRLPVAVRAPILRSARLLWSRSPEIPVDFAAATLKEYFDLEPYLARYDRELLRQAAAGSLR